jgi:short-subunit dehydrogenase
MNVNWGEKVVFITGASSGIGRALSIELARRGATIGLFARRADVLREIQIEIENAGGQSLALAGDVRDAEALRVATAELRARFGKIDTLIANAGISAAKHVTEISAEEAARVIEVNMTGATNAVAAVLPDMLARRSGHLVAISSLAAYRGLPCSYPYSGTKAGLTALFESLRVDLRDAGIDVTIIHPGFVRTPLLKDRTKRKPFLMETAEANRHIIRAIEMRRRSVTFPWQLATVVRLIQFAPDFLYDRLAARISVRE